MKDSILVFILSCSESRRWIRSALTFTSLGVSLLRYTGLFLVWLNRLAPEQAMETRKTILVVDDDENQRFLYQEVLTDEGYDIMVARDGKEALEKVEQKTPDLVILDIVMPEMDGMEAMTRILRKHRKIPIILNTSYPRYREDFMTWAADAYVVKSSDFTELKEKIRKLISTSP